MVAGQHGTAGNPARPGFGIGQVDFAARRDRRHRGLPAQIEASHAFPQSMGIGGTAHKPMEFTKTEGEVPAMARDAAEFRLPFDDDNVPEAAFAKALGGRQPRRPAAEDDDVMPNHVVEAI